MPDLAPAAPNLPTANTKGDFIVQFWGVRDQISAPGNKTVRYGGNTSCVEVRVGEKILIFDGGSGLRLLGNHLLKQMPLEAYMFLTYCHWDSIQGFPFFKPAYIAGNCFHIYGATAADGQSIERRMGCQMLAPNFPVPMKVMQSELQFYNLTAAPNNQIFIDDVVVEAAYLNYSNRSLGYRVTWQGRSLVYATSRLFYPNNLDKNLLHLGNQADLLILNAPGAISLDDTRNCSPLKWQDKLWQTGMATVKQADVKRVVLSRYDPDYDDDFLDTVAEQIQSVLPNHLLAREGMILQIL
ncbi:MBL fold metallo-hydrolase [Lyngbya aestuarii]|uniref:MBL fold metallo-hydrolase n=1 Tax=Lyngbya aestuarii TaxID=118322 RepID=UPI00403E3187